MDRSAKTFLGFGIAVPALFILIQFFGPAKTNPPFDPSGTIEANLQVPPPIQGILKRACQNCHSHQTEWPWYSNVAPVSWFVIDHVDHGRSHMNFSDWTQYDREKTIGLMEELCEMVETREMPLYSYLWMHGEAQLSEEDIATLCEWAKGEQQRLMGD